MNIKNEEFLLIFLKIFFSEYEMILKKKYKNIINNFKKNMNYLEKKINILLPNGKKEIVFLKNLNFDGSLLIEKQDKEENIFSARIINDFN